MENAEPLARVGLKTLKCILCPQSYALVCTSIATTLLHYIPVYLTVRPRADAHPEVSVHRGMGAVGGLLLMWFRSIAKLSEVGIL